MLHSKLCYNLKMLNHFIDNALGLSYETHKITGYELLYPLLSSASHNTYIETLGNKADTLYEDIKFSQKSMTTFSYLDYIKRVSKKFKIYNKNVMLAFDYTDEDFYGEVYGFDIHGWTGKNAVTGKFKFLTCSIVSDAIPQKIPLVSLPIRIGHYKSSVILECLHLIRDIVGKIDLILFDRGFYDKDLMFELNKLEYPYLIFVPKHQDKKFILHSMEVGEEIAIYNKFKISKDKTIFTDENILIFLKQIYNSRSGRNYDWIFATNVEKILLEKLIVLYKKRWRIETQFRVQDEAMIKCKSKNMKIRYFLFCFEQMLQTIWICFFKDELSFKEFLIEMEKLGFNWTKKKR